MNTIFKCFRILLIGSLFLRVDVAFCSPQSDSSKRVIEQYLYQGDTQLSQGPDKAISYYNQALQYASNHQDNILLAKCYSKLGEAHYLAGSFYSALYYHQKALIIYDEEKLDSLEADELSKIGSIYYFSDIGELEKALQFYNASYAEFERLGLLAPAGLNLNFSAYVYWAKGEKEEALAIHKKAFETFEKVNNKLGMATSLSDIGFTLNSIGNFKEALKNNLEAYTLERELENKQMQVPTLNNIGLSYLGLNMLDSAQYYSELSLSLANIQGLLLRQNEASSTLVNIYDAQGKKSQAFDMLKTHKLLNDSLKNSTQARKLMAFEIGRDYELKEQEAALKALKAQELAEIKLSKRKRTIIGLTVILILALALIAVISRAVIIRKKANEQLALQQQELEEKNKALENALSELKETQAQLIQSEKMASLGTMTAGVPHEINNPLNFIQGGIYALEDVLKENVVSKKEENIEILAQMQMGVNRASEIVRSLSRFSRRDDDFEMTTLNLSEVINNCLLILNHSLKYKCEILTDFSPECESVISNENALHHIIVNLIANAADAIQKEGTIKISTYLDQDKNPTICVEDNGEGMPAHVLARIFDPFFTTKKPGAGTGLGLSISYTLTKSLKAKLWHESEPEKGTKAFLALTNDRYHG